MGELEIGDVRGFAVRVGAGRLDVRALDEAYVYAGGGQRVDVAGRAQEVRLHGCAESVGQAAGGDVQDALLDPVGPGDVLGADLQPSAGWERFGDPGDAVCRAGGIHVEGEMREIQGQPRVGRGRRKERRQLQVFVDHAGRVVRVLGQLTEEIDADAVTLGELVRGHVERFVAGPAGDVPRGGAPGVLLTAG